MLLSRGERRLIRPAILFEDHPLVALTPLDVHRVAYPMPMVFAFQSPAPADFTPRFEATLRVVLNRYRVLAGRTCRDGSGKLCIRLTDEGVPLIEAHAGVKLKGFLEQGGYELLHQLTPLTIYQAGEFVVPLSIQVTRFDCGCIVVGTERNHRVFDANALPAFLLDVATALNDAEATNLFKPISQDRSCLMPRNPPRPIFNHEISALAVGAPCSESDITFIRIHFSKEKLAELKAEANLKVNNVSTFVSLAAYLWRLITIVRKLDAETKTTLLCPINGRRLLDLPHDFFGNAVIRAQIQSSAQALTNNPLGETASLIQSHIQKCSNPDYFRSEVDFLALKGSSGKVHMDEHPQLAKSASPNLVVTSWARLPLYDIDFGFGRPVLAAPTKYLTEGVATVTPSPSSNKDGSLDVTFNIHRHQVAALLALV